MIINMITNLNVCTITLKKEIIQWRSCSISLQTLSQTLFILDLIYLRLYLSLYALKSILTSRVCEVKANCSGKVMDGQFEYLLKVQPL